MPRQSVETLRPHVLVSDIGMPDDGVKLVREVRKLAETKGLSIPAIAITAFRDRHDLFAEGFVELLEQPLDPAMLCQAIRRHARDQQ